MRISPGRSVSRICDISSGVSTPPMWHMTLAPVPALSQAAIARFKGSRPFLAITFSDMRTFTPSTMSAFSPTALAAVSTCAKSIL